MQSEQSGSTNGQGTRPSAPSGESRQLRELRATCRRQASVIASLRAAVENIHRGAKALKAENSELRADNHRIDVARRSRLGTDGRVVIGEPLEVVLPLDVQAPGAARAAVARYLDALAAASLLDSAQLLISELVTNSVRHSGAVSDAQLTQGEPRPVLVPDGGRGPQPRRRHLAPTSGRRQRRRIGPNLVQTLSERWGLERGGTRGTRVWAELSHSLIGAGADLGAYGAPQLRTYTAL